MFLLDLKGRPTYADEPFQSETLSRSRWCHRGIGSPAGNHLRVSHRPSGHLRDRTEVAAHLRGGDGSSRCYSCLHALHPRHSGVNHSEGSKHVFRYLETRGHTDKATKAICFYHHIDLVAAEKVLQEIRDTLHTAKKPIPMLQARPVRVSNSSDLPRQCGIERDHCGFPPHGLLHLQRHRCSQLVRRRPAY